VDIYIVPDGSQTQYPGYMKLLAYGPYYYLPAVFKYVHELNIDYPAKGDPFYVPHLDYTTISAWKFAPEGEETCYLQMFPLYTDFFDTEDYYRTTFKWFSMGNVVYDSGTGRVVGIGDGYWSGYWYTVYNNE
jgi:hypothetical protein